MTADEIKAIIRLFVDEPWNQGNVEIVDELCAPHYSLRYDTESQTSGRDAFKQSVLKNRARLDNFHAETDEIIVEGERAAYHWTMRGTDPQGVVQTMVGITLLRFEDGKIVEDRFLSGFIKPEQAGA